MSKFAYGLDKGCIREKNEDNANCVTNANKDTFMVVIDGMGGHQLGDVASKKICTSLINSFQKKRKFFNTASMINFLKSAIKQANKELIEFSKINPSSKGMGATMACYLIHEDKVVYAYLGDSRAYRILNKRLIQVSKDETYVQYLFDTGKITREEMKNHPSRHVVTNALGGRLAININCFKLKENYDYLLLCSDGLYNMVSEDKILEIILSNNNLQIAVNKLIYEANMNGGLDNISCCIYRKED